MSNSVSNRRRFWKLFVDLMIKYFCGFLLMLSANEAQAEKLQVDWNEQFRGTPLELSSYKLAFSEEFDGKEQLKGPKLFAPVHAPYGANTFDFPPSPAYHVADGTLRLEAYKDQGKWRSGMVQTANDAQSYHGARFGSGKGFVCANCYFEARMRFPAGKVPGFWGAFWLLSPDHPKTGHVEIDVIEWYGGDPRGHHQSVHVWPKRPGVHAGKSNYTGMQGVITDGQWHSYGARVEKGTVYIYMDRKEVSRVDVPAEFDVSYYLVAGLAVLPQEVKLAPDLMQLDVDYLRAYKPTSK